MVLYQAGEDLSLSTGEREVTRVVQRANSGNVIGISRRTRGPREE